MLSVNLDGELLGDGVMRSGFQLNLTILNGRLSGTGTTNGAWVRPGAWRDTKRKSKALQVRAVSLVRVSARSP